MRKFVAQPVTILPVGYKTVGWAPQIPEANESEMKVVIA